jgi:hypothetical protein
MQISTLGYLSQSSMNCDPDIRFVKEQRILKTAQQNMTFIAHQQNNEKGKE